MKRVAAMLAAGALALAVYPAAAQIDFSGLNQYQGLQGQMCPVVGCGGGAALGGGAARPPAPPSPQAAINGMAMQMGMMLLMAAIQQSQEDADAEAQRQAAWRAEMDRLAGIEQQRTDAQKQRLLGEINTEGLTTGGSVARDDSLATGGGFSRNVDATPATATLATVPADSVSAQLTGAAYFSQLAENASSDEDAAVFAEKAFDSAMGYPTDIAVPTSTPAVPVSQEAIPQIQEVRASYNAALTNAHDAVANYTQHVQQSAVLEGMLGRFKSNRAKIEHFDEVESEAEKAWHEEQRQTVAALKALNNAQQALETSAVTTKNYFQDYLSKHLAYDSTHQPEKDAYLKGAADASDCLPSNAAGYCTRLDAATTATCVANYKNGYQVGQILKEARLKDAYNIGAATKAANRPLSSPVYHDSVGVCGVHWVEAYNEGFFGRPYHTVGR